MAENNFEKLLGKNGELVEERKKQVLAGALEIVQRYCEETPNKMEVVAALFGKKLGEEFRVRRNYYLSGITVKAKFIDKGFQVFYEGSDYWQYRPEGLVDLLTGKAVIINE